MYPYLGMVPGPVGIGSQVAQNVDEQGLANGLLASAGTMATPALVRGLLGKAAGGVTRQAMTEYDKRHKQAQRNAAKPIEKGGLGLPPNNTAEDRARALGFDVRGWRGTRSDEHLPRGPVWWSEDKDYANAFASVTIRPPKGQPDTSASNVMPLLIKRGNAVPFNKFGIGGVPDESKLRVGRGGVETGYRQYENLTVPENVRSLFAAFDPKKAGNVGWFD